MLNVEMLHFCLLTLDLQLPQKIITNQQYLGLEYDGVEDNPHR